MMMDKFVAGLVVLVGVCSSASIPSYIEICKRNDPNLNQCIINSLEHLQPKLKTGIPELNVPPMEPLRIPSINIDRGTGSSVFQLKLDDVDVYGGSGFKLNTLKLDLKNLIFKIGVNFPKLRLVGDCDVDTKILSLPIKGNGKFDADINNCDATGILKAETYDKNGQQYLKFTDLTLKFKIDDYDLKVANLFDEDTLNESINELIIQNKDQFIQLATPYIESKSSELILEMANQIVKSYPLEDLMPSN